MCEADKQPAGCRCELLSCDPDCDERYVCSLWAKYRETFVVARDFRDCYHSAVTLT